MLCVSCLFDACQIIVRDVDGGEVEEAAEWWAAAAAEEMEEWNMEVEAQLAEAEARRQYAKKAAVEQEERAAAVAAAKREEEERESIIDSRPRPRCARSSSCSRRIARTSIGPKRFSCQRKTRGGQTSASPSPLSALSG